MNTPTAFPFLRLPRELRDEVYQYLLIPESPLVLRQRYKILYTLGSYVRVESISRGLEAKILFVSRQIHQEAKKVLYGRNDLLLEFYEGLQQGTRICPITFAPRNLELVHSMVLQMTHFLDRASSVASRPLDMHILASCCNLQKLQLDLQVALATGAGFRLPGSPRAEELQDRMVKALMWFEATSDQVVLDHWSQEVIRSAARQVVKSVKFSLYFISKNDKAIPLSQIVETAQEARVAFEMED